MANWLLSIQMEDGAFSGGLYNPKKDLQKSIFNTAQIIIGLYSRYSNTNNIIYLESGIKASNWLASCINENGFLINIITKMVLCQVIIQEYVGPFYFSKTLMVTGKKI